MTYWDGLGQTVSITIKAPFLVENVHNDWYLAHRALERIWAKKRGSVFHICSMIVFGGGVESNFGQHQNILEKCRANVS